MTTHSDLISSAVERLHRAEENRNSAADVLAYAVVRHSEPPSDWLTDRYLVASAAFTEARVDLREALARSAAERVRSQS